MVSGDINSPDVLRAINELTEKLSSESGVGKVFSISQAVREMTRAIYRPGEAGYDRIPESREGIAQLFELYNMSGDQGDFDQIMNKENSKAHILIRLSDPTNKVINNVQATIKKAENNFPANLTTGGYAIIMSDFGRVNNKRASIFPVVCSNYSFSPAVNYFQIVQRRSGWYNPPGSINPYIIWFYGIFRYSS